MKAAILSLVLAVSGCTAKKDAQEVNLAIWANYIPAGAEKSFQEQTGIKIRISNYSSNEELLAKVQAGGSGIDVAVPSDYMVEIMGKQGMLAELNKAEIANLMEISPDYLNQAFDAKNRYSIPYAWSTTGIVVNTKLVKTPIAGWADLLKAAELRGKISLLDDAREVIGAGLKASGYSMNSRDEKELRLAKSWLEKLKPSVKFFRTDVNDPVLNREVLVAQMYSSDAMKAVSKMPEELTYIIPVEGGTRSIDNLVIMKNAKNVQAAHKLLNFFISKKYGTDLTSQMKAGPVVKNLREQLPKEVAQMSGLFPSASVLEKLEFIRDLGDATPLVDRIWTELKTGG